MATAGRPRQRLAQLIEPCPLRPRALPRRTGAAGTAQRRSRRRRSAAGRAGVAGDPVAAAQLRELDARERQSARADDIGVLLAERIAFLDRPAFATFFRTDGRGRQFSLRAIEHPLRVRVDLPERGHAEASRIVARLILAQFTEAALSRSDRSLFAALVLDDATYTVTADSVRAVQRLRSANAGVVFALRTLEDVPEPLRGPLLGAVGCRMAFAGLAPSDGGAGRPSLGHRNGPPVPVCLLGKTCRMRGRVIGLSRWPNGAAAGGAGRSPPAAGDGGGLRQARPGTWRCRFRGLTEGEDWFPTAMISCSLLWRWRR